MHRFILDRLKRYAVYQPPLRMETCLSRLIRGVPRGGEGERSKKVDFKFNTTPSAPLTCPVHMREQSRSEDYAHSQESFLLYRKFFEKQIQEICLN
jgi:hypothetical protein